jgi:Imidazolonepropionase and related amidohydrolases
VLTHGSNTKSQEFTPAELTAAVEEAHSFGLKVAAHAHSADGIKNAVRAGVASIEHGTYLDDEGIRLMKEHGTFLSATLDVHDCITSAPNTPADFLEHNRGIADIHYSGFRKAVQSGVKIAFSTDVPVCPYANAGKEFAYMVKNGMTPMQAIQAATMGGGGADRRSRQGGIDQKGQARRSHRGAGRPHEGCYAAGARAIRDEGRQGVQVTRCIGDDNELIEVR